MRKERRFRRVAGGLLLAAAASAAEAQDATLLANPVDDDFNNPLNWTGGAVPTGTAFFGGEDVVQASSANIQLGGITMLPGAGANVLDLSTVGFTLDGAGITISGGSLQLDNRGGSFLKVANLATTGSAGISNLDGSILSFADDSNAGTSTIGNNATLEFSGRASAGSASIDNGAGAALRFVDEATLGDASIDNSGGVSFEGTSTGGNGSIQNRAGATLVFSEQGSAGDATIVNSSSALLGLVFSDESTAGNATITTKDGGQTQFAFFADGGTAAFETDATSTVDFSGSLGPLGDGVVHAGSIAGAGTYVVGFDQTLVVGGNNRSTEVSGTIVDSSVGGTVGGIITKVGSGTLTLSGANTYSGATKVSGGTLAVKSSGKLGSGNVSVTNATLELAGASLGNAIGILGVGAGNVGAIRAASGSSTLSGAITLVGSSTIAVDAGATLALTNTASITGANRGLTLHGAGDGSTGAISLGFRGLIKTGTGSWTLNAANSYGSTTISEGTLIVGNAGTLGTGAVDIATGATLGLSGATIGNAITAAGFGVGNLGAIRALAGANVISGDISATSNLRIGVAAGATLAVTGAVTIPVAGQRLTLDGDGDGTIGAFSIASAVLRKQGTGTWTLTAAGTYSWGSLIEQGTLVANSAAALGTGPITLRGGTFRAGADITFNNRIQLSIAAGTIDSGGHALVSNGEVTGGSPFLITNSLGASGSLTLAGINSTWGTTTVSSSGTLIAGSTTGLSNQVDYVIDGTLRLAGFDSTLKSLAGSGVVRNAGAAAATLTLMPATGTTSFSGTLADGAGGGALALTKTGAGIQALTGANTYTGATTVDGGTFVVSGAGSLGNTAVTINTGARLEADGATGGGGLGIGAAIRVNAGGMFAVMGPETVGSLAGTGATTLGASLAAGADGSDTTYSGVATGAGSLTKQGTGRMILAGVNTFTGVTRVERGVLEVGVAGAIDPAGFSTVGGGGLVVNGSAGAVTVNGGYLGGTGTVGVTQVMAGGTLAPGNSIGTLTVAGNLSLATGATYAVEVSPTDADRVNVQGTANLGNAMVATTYAVGQYIQRQYTIVNATGGVVGTFGGLTGTAPTGFTQSLSYDSNNAYLVLTLLMSPGGGGQGGGLGPYANLDANQFAVAQAITAAFLANGGIDARFAALDANGLTQAGGQTSTAAAGAGLQAAGQFVDAMGDLSITGGNLAPSGDMSNAYAPLAYSAEPANLSSPGALAALGETMPASSDAANAALAMSSAHDADPVDVAMATRWKMWGSVYGNVALIRGDAVVGSSDLTARNWGIASGFNRSFGDSRLGLSLGGAGSTFTLGNGLGSGSAGIFNAGVYGSHNFGNAYMSGALAYGWNNVRTTRNVPGDTLTANFNAHTLAGRIEGGYRFGSTSAVTPYVAVQGASYFLPAYTETAALGRPFALAYGRQSEAALRTELGARFEHSMPTSTGSLKVSARAAWAYNARNDRAVTAAFASLPGQTFTTNGARPARHSALIDLGVEASLDSGLSAKLSFNGEFSRNVSAYGASAKVIYRW